MKKKINKYNGPIHAQMFLSEFFDIQGVGHDIQGPNLYYKQLTEKQKKEANDILYSIGQPQTIK